jgi:hypothetical protein
MAQHHDQLAAQFATTMTSFTDEWGFVVVRTVYGDDEAWSTALAKLREYALLSEEKKRTPSDKFSLPVMADQSLEGASYDEVRTFFNAWVKRYEEEHQWTSDVRRDCCLVVDGPALASLLEAPEQETPWVVAVDAQDPATIPYSGGGPFLGWTRVSTRCVRELFGDLDHNGSLAEVCPRRLYDGQITLYDGFPSRTLIDPPGGVGGRYKFPMGTPRGVEGGKAMLAEIGRALGHDVVAPILLAMAEEDR